MSNGTLLMEFSASISAALELVSSGAVDREAIAATGCDSIEELILKYLRTHRPWAPANAADVLRLQRFGKNVLLSAHPRRVYFDIMIGVTSANIASVHYSTLNLIGEEQSSLCLCVLSLCCENCRFYIIVVLCTICRFNSHVFIHALLGHLWLSGKLEISTCSPRSFTALLMKVTIIISYIFSLK